MQRILSKRVLRDIRENLLRYLALFFLVALVMYMVVAIVGAAETIMQGTKESGRVHHREDGQFGVFVPLTEKGKPPRRIHTDTRVHAETIFIISKVHAII
jgi:putative ABC transport system permease protein